MKRAIIILLVMYGVVSAATMGKMIAQGWQPVMVPPGQTLDGLLGGAGTVSSGGGGGGSNVGGSQTGGRGGSGIIIVRYAIQ